MKKQSEEKLDRKIANEVDSNLRQQRSAGAQPRPHQFPVYTATASASASAKPAPIPIAKDTIGIYTDPVFGLRIVHPLISSSAMQDRMQGRTAVSVSNLRHHLAHGDQTKDWAIAGVLVQKGAVQTSKKGSQYMIWKLSDLRGDIKMVSLFLFKSACKDMWKTAQGMVVAVLNPGVMDNNQQDESCLSVDNTQKFMILGQSKDLGVCKAKKKNGDPCAAVVNKGVCEFCVYHVKQEYSKMSTRVELQSATSGRGLDALRNKVLGKSEVFYGGQSFQSIPTKKNPKLVAKDNKRMATLSEYYQSPTQGGHPSPRSPYANAQPTSRMASSVETNILQRKKDIDRLKLLEAESARHNALHPLASTSKAPPPPVVVPMVPDKFRSLEFSSQQKPTLQRDGFSLDITVASLRKSELNKAKALDVLRKTPIAKSNPNFVRHRGTVEGKKRALDDLSARDPSQVKKQKITEAAERFQKERIAAIINAKSSHTDLIEAKQQESQDKYFDKLEKKEAMEEKMLSTFQMDCKAVTCLKCRYTAFSASALCKEEKHPLKVVDAQKRFFECEDCGYRTTTVQRMPQMSCKNCQGSKWRRAAMIREKKADSLAQTLSIRGDEETFIGSVATSGNLNLCVADE